METTDPARPRPRRLVPMRDHEIAAIVVATVAALLVLAALNGYYVWDL